MAEFESEKDFSFLNSVPSLSGTSAETPMINNVGSGQMEEVKKGEDVEELEGDPEVHELYKYYDI